MNARGLPEVLEELVSRGTVRVPPYPSTAMRLQQVLAGDFTVAALVEAMRTDQVFTGNLLRLANCPLYRRDGEVTSLPTAVMRVGSRELTRLAMAAAVGQVANSDGPLAALRRRAWRESLASALLGETLARGAGGDPAEAFVAGLLHDVGKLLVLSTLEEALHREPGLPSDEATCGALVEAHHLRLGGLLAQRWQLPAVLEEIITGHHAVTPESSALLRTIARVDGLVALLEQDTFITAEALETAGLQGPEVRAVLELVPRIPAFIASLESAREGSPLHPPPVAASEGPRVDGCPVLAIGPEIAVKTARAVPRELLLEVKLEPAGSTLWVVVTACEATNEGFEVTLRPYAHAEP